MCFLYWRIWRETEKRYKDLTTLFLVSARVQVPPKSSSGGGFWRSLLAAPSAVVGAVVKGGGSARPDPTTVTEKTETDAEVTSTCETSEGTVPVSTSGSLCSSHWSTMGGTNGGATNSNTANSIYTILITLPPAPTPTGDQPPSSTSVSTPDSHSKFYVNDSDDMQPISIKQFSVGGGMAISDSGRKSGHVTDHDGEEKVTDSGNGNKRRSTTSNTPPRLTSSAVSQPKSEKKAAKTLSAILLAFVLTWTPYNVLVLLKTFTGTISGTVFEAANNYQELVIYVCR